MNQTLKKIILKPFNWLYNINPKFELQLLYFLKFRRVLNFEKPKYYTEKLNWMKLYYRNPLIPTLVDKYTARAYIASCGYESWLPKIYWSGFDVDIIPFEELPEKFVLKATNGSGNNIICSDKNALDKNEVKIKLKKSLNEKYIPCYGEWFYGVIKPRIIVEEFLSDGLGIVPVDYKMFYFSKIDGVVCTAVDTGRFVEHKRTIYDSDWKPLNQVKFNFRVDFENRIKKPACYDEMVKCCQVLGKKFPHVRVDFYVVQGQPYIGEMTFMNGAGFDKITPKEYDLFLGSLIEIEGR